MQNRNRIEVNVSLTGDRANDYPLITNLAPELLESNIDQESPLFPTALECILSSGMRPIRMLPQVNGRLNLQVSS